MLLVIRKDPQNQMQLKNYRKQKMFNSENEQNTETQMNNVILPYKA